MYVLALGFCCYHNGRTFAVDQLLHVKVSRVKLNLIAGVSCRDFAVIKICLLFIVCLVVLQYSLLSYMLAYTG